MVPGESFRRDGTHLNRKLQNHVDDSFPTTGKVEPFREPDPEAPKDRTRKRWKEKFSSVYQLPTSQKLSCNLGQWRQAQISNSLECVRSKWDLRPKLAELGEDRVRGQEHDLCIDNGAWGWEVSGLGSCPNPEPTLILPLPQLPCRLEDILSEHREELGDGTEWQRWGQA